MTKEKSVDAMAQMRVTVAMLSSLIAVVMRNMITTLNGRNCAPTKWKTVWVQELVSQNVLHVCAKKKWNHK